MRYAILENDTVVNIVEAAKKSDINLAEGQTAVAMPKKGAVNIGDKKTGKEYKPPTLSVDREVLRQRTRQRLAAIADPLFFKWQAGEATKEDWLSARDEALKNYRDA